TVKLHHLTVDTQLVSQHRRRAVINIDINHDKGDVVFRHPTEALLVLQPIPARLLEKFEIACIVNMLVNIEMITTDFDKGLMHRERPLLPGDYRKKEPLMAPSPVWSSRQTGKTCKM